MIKLPSWFTRRDAGKQSKGAPVDPGQAIRARLEEARTDLSAASQRVADLTAIEASERTTQAVEAVEDAEAEVRRLRRWVTAVEAELSAHEAAEAEAERQRLEARRAELVEAISYDAIQAGLAPLDERRLAAYETLAAIDLEADEQHRAHRALARELEQVERRLGLPDRHREFWLDEQGRSRTPEARPDQHVDLLAASPVRLRQTLTAARSRDHRALDGIRLTGEASKIAGIAGWLERQLGLPVEVVETLPGGDGTDPAFAQALGLALRGLERGRGALNFRKGPYAFHGDLGYLKGKLLRIGAAAAVILVLLSLNAWSRLSVLTKQDEALDEALCSVTLRVLGSCESDFNIALSKLRGGETKAAQIPSTSALDVMSAAIDKIPADVGLQVTEIETTQDRLRLSGVVDSFEGVERVESALREHECFGDVRQGRVQKNREDKVELTLDATYVCGQEEAKG